ncbi:LysR family transcriptional regulator [Paraburkholderia solisilvae]|uniref:HTH-type transcriptional regulator HdfR n=1 Tax=Paraburkholderia solisilvae TaxID=624376 RepID=A0A6J5EGS6_9BURK|nr:LysR family transcriptional regulator [Paraburkholderia solisilvae]CAB3764235.1 HTH-type transcriptional regulator HdfR [Paraburkholderia solisilvae]
MRDYLDVSAVEAFVLVADLRSFTRAGEALGFSQAGISMKLRRLETSLGRRLLVRTPRRVRLTEEGDAFLPRARALLGAHELAVSSAGQPTRRLTLGISEHVAGPELPDILAKVKSYDSGLLIQVRVDSSATLIDAFERDELDVAVVRRQRRRHDDDVLFPDSYGWFGTLKYETLSLPLPLVSVEEACGVRSIATRLLTQAKIEWLDAFIGGGMGAVLAAVSAGIGVAPLPRRLATTGLIDVGDRFGLPPLPKADVVMLSHPTHAQTTATLRVLGAAFRSSVAEE